MNQKSVRQIWSLLGMAVAVNAFLGTAFMLLVVPAEVWFNNLESTLFLPASLFAHFSFLFFLVAFTLLLVYLLHLRNKSWIFFAVILFSALLLIVIIDTRIFTLYRFHLNSMVLNLMLGGAAGEILSFSWRMLGSIVLAILFVAGIQFLFLKWLFQQHRFSGKGSWPAILVLMISTQLFYGYKDAVADVSITTLLRYIPWAQPLTMKRTLRKLGVIDSITKKPSLNIKRHSVLNYPKSPMVCNQPEKLNYLVLMVDSVRFDMLNSEVMPNTYEFAQSSLVFNQHWSTSNSTRFGIFGFFYGMPSTYWFDILKAQKGSVLFDVLKDQNYQFHLDASAPLNSPEFDRTVFSEVRESLQWGAKGSELETDTVVINRLLEFLDKDHQQNFFAFSFIDAAHAYQLPKGETPHFQPALKAVNYLALNNDYDPQAFFNLYKSSVHYNDRLLGLVYKKLAERGLLSNTVVIITSDHGQEFNELKQNFWGHNSSFSAYQVKVPLVIYWPGKPAQQISKATSHEDVIPGLLTEGLGCQNKISDYSTGYSLFDEKKLPHNRNLLFANWNNKAIYTGDTYYNFTSFGTVEVLDNNYVLKKNQHIEHEVIQQQLSRMSQFLK